MQGVYVVGSIRLSCRLILHINITTARAITVVIPVYNSEASLPELCRRLTEVLSAVGTSYEMIFVNDCSRDCSWEVISQLAVAVPGVRGINLMRNYGQHNALLCGIRAARGDLIVTMDDDLQHQPEEIPRLLARLDEGFDVVYATPEREPAWSLARDRLTYHAIGTSLRSCESRSRQKRQRVPCVSN